MAKDLFHFGFDGGVTHSSGYEEDGQIILTETMPKGVVQEILDANQETARSDPMATARSNGTLGVIGGRIPITEHYKWRKEWREGPKLWGTPWHVFLKRKLNDPDHRKFRFMEL